MSLVNICSSVNMWVHALQRISDGLSGWAQFLLERISDINAIALSTRAQGSVVPHGLILNSSNYFGRPSKGSLDSLTRNLHYELLLNQSEGQLPKASKDAENHRNRNPQTEVVSNNEVRMSNPKPQEATGQEEKEIKGSNHIWVW